MKILSWKYQNYSIDETSKKATCRCLPNHCLLRQALFTGVGVGWKKARSG